MATLLKSVLLFTLGLLLALSANLPILAKNAVSGVPQSGQVCSLQAQSNHNSQPQVLAQMLDNEGHQRFQQGQTQAALDCWRQAGKLYSQIGNEAGLAISRLNEAQALQGLGYYFQAKELLIKLKDLPYYEQDARFKTRVSRSLGDVLRSLGEFTKSQEPPAPNSKDGKPKKVYDSQTELEESLKTARNKGFVEDEIAALISLGNTQRAIAKQARDRRESREYATSGDCKQYQGEKEQGLAITALSSYKTAADQAKAALPTTYIQAQLNRISLLHELGKEQDAETQTVLSDIKTQLNQLPSNRATIYAQLNLAQTLSCFKSMPDLEIKQLLTQTLEQATALNDSRAKSYALGYLGHLDEKAGKEKRANALKQTQDALLVAQAIGAPEIAYRWQWQLGRILAQSAGQEKQKQIIKSTTTNINDLAYIDAIAAYQEAVKTLKPVRNDLLAASSDVQFSFRDDIEPVYRELVELLLSTPGKSNELQDFFKNAIQYIDELQLAELENFFRCTLVNTQKSQVDKTPDPNAATFYMVFLRDRVDVMLKLPGQENLIHYPSIVKRSELEENLERFRKDLSRKSSEVDAVKATSQAIYDVLLKQAKADLEGADDIKTLVFVLDGNLRDIPMAALYDGEHYLIEKYAVAVTPGLELLGSQRNHSGLSGALLAGLTTANSVTIEGNTIPFNELLNVEDEIRQIKELLPTSEVLLNEKFTTEKFRNAIESSSYPIVHIATHGQFSSNPKETFLLTASQKPVDLNELQVILRNRNQTKSYPIELLVFSACQTAEGDRRATLGLAGIALRAGAFGTLASLWAVDDRATAKLMVEFYRALSDRNVPVSKAEALRQAQLGFLHSNEIIQTATNIRGRRSLAVAEPDYDIPSTKSHPRYWAPFVLVGNWL